MNLVVLDNFGDPKWIKEPDEVYEHGGVLRSRDHIHSITLLTLYDRQANMLQQLPPPDSHFSPTYPLKSGRRSSPTHRRRILMTTVLSMSFFNNQSGRDINPTLTRRERMEIEDLIKNHEVVTTEADFQNHHPHTENECCYERIPEPSVTPGVPNCHCSDNFKAATKIHQVVFHKAEKMREDEGCL